MKLIMACIDFSQSTDPVIAAAAELARATGAGLMLVHVEMLPRPIMYGEMMTGVEAAEACGERMRQTRALLDALRDGLDGKRGLHVTSHLLEGIKASPLLVGEAERTQPDVIVMGSHGYGVLDRWLMGSTSQEVIREGKWPVMVIPSPRVWAATTHPAGLTGQAEHPTLATL